jgi:hypothetical protein
MHCNGVDLPVDCRRLSCFQLEACVMTMARGSIVDSAVTPYYHCISRCVRRAFLCGEGHEDRKQWIEDRLKELAGIFAIEVCGYAVLDNHLHVVLRLNDARAAGWSDEEVVRRWGRLFPPRGKDREPLEATDTWVAAMLQDKRWVATARERLNSLGWFMKCVKEPLARLANKQDQCRGTFWESRFKSIAILDEEALLTTLAYVDLNLVAAGLVKTVEESPHTSIKARVERCREIGTLEAVVDQPVDRTKHDEMLEDEDHWLVPIEDRREDAGATPSSGLRPPSPAEAEGEGTAGEQSTRRVARAGMCGRMNLAGYLRLLDWSARCLGRETGHNTAGGGNRVFRPGKRRVPKDVAGILGRLGSDADLWQDRLEKLRDRDRIFGTVFATKRAEINRLAERRGVSKLANLNGCRS